MRVSKRDSMQDSTAYEKDKQQKQCKC